MRANNKKETEGLSKKAIIDVITHAPSNRKERLLQFYLFLLALGICICDNLYYVHIYSAHQ